MSALAGGLFLVVPSGTASADLNTCLNYPGSTDTLSFNNPYITTVTVINPITGLPEQRQQLATFRFPDNHTHDRVSLTFWVLQRTPTFNPAARTFVDNRTDQPVMATFSLTDSATQSRTFTISESQTTGITGSFINTSFNRTVSTSTTDSITTSISITGSQVVPPHSRVNADFGVDAFNVTYNVAFWQRSDHECWYHGSHDNVVANVPTTSQGWRFSPAEPI
ncbi:MAG TPA: hypothetical protein VGR06_08680 [Actinophytocola sp.]|uniref:hypothetical protein n=1 Tax=Actinophytocola sp. TaxID=1872138 RepID=UPI002DFF7FA6|nr:hypothetical protein [Actinophytocola sp.]